MGLFKKIAQIFGRTVEHLTVCCIIFLMAFHNSGKKVAVFFLRKGLYSLDGRKGLEAELGAETEVVFHVLTEWLLAMPYIPVMAIAAVLITWIVEASS